MSNENLTELVDGFNKLNFTDCQKSADKNDPDGIYRLGYCYEYGIGVEKDENKIHHRLASLLDKDYKKKRNEKKAFTNYKKSADMKNSNGMYQVGYCYNLGIGVEIDKHKAFTNYLKSAEAGNSNGIQKTAFCYGYGIGVKKDENKFHEWIRKKPEYGKCAHCNEDNMRPAWCLSCDPDIATRWTSGNKDIDDCMKEFQLRAWSYEDAIEWIPFNKLSDIKEFGKGGFGSVYSATWLDGIRKVDGDYNYVRTRESSSIVALKTLSSSKGNNDFLKEFKSLMTCKLNHSNLAIYGITQNTVTKDYLMVFHYANNGSLHKYLRSNFSKLTWQTKLQILKDTAEELNSIHDYAGYIHANFHSGNILLDQRSYIADLRLSRKVNENVSGDEIYGVMPYVAPEVLSGKQQFTQAADIYGFGVIMAEMSTGQRPFDGQEFDHKLAFKICSRGLRPEFAPGTPKCYIELAEECMNSDPQKRPRAREVRNTISSWFRKISSSNDNEIKKQFLDDDKVIKSLSIPKHPDGVYTSKLINTKLISKAIKDLSQVDSAQIKLDITEF